MDTTLVAFTCVNHRGERSARRVRPIRLWHGSTAFHPEPQWFVECLDLDKLQTRDFAMANVTDWRRLDAAPEKGAAPMAEKKPLTGLFRDNPETREGKYLILRRDGTVPPWPSFVLGGADPHAAAALRAYALSCEGDPAIDPGFVAAVRRWADEYDRWREAHGAGDPGMGPHRTDDPAVVARMREGMSA